MTKYSDSFDRALVTSEVCLHLFEDVEKCKIEVAWDHPYDTRDQVLRKEFADEVEDVIHASVDRIMEEQKRSDYKRKIEDL